MLFFFHFYVSDLSFVCILDKQGWHYMITIFIYKMHHQIMKSLNWLFSKINYFVFGSTQILFHHFIYKPSIFVSTSFFAPFYLFESGKSSAVLRLWLWLLRSHLSIKRRTNQQISLVPHQTTAAPASFVPPHLHTPARDEVRLLQLLRVFKLLKLVGFKRCAGSPSRQMVAFSAGKSVLLSLLLLPMFLHICHSNWFRTELYFWRKGLTKTLREALVYFVWK